MEKVTHVNDIIRSLPGIRQLRFWNVIVNGVAVCGVKAKTKDKAMEHVRKMYPTGNIELKFMGWRI